MAEPLSTLTMHDIQNLKAVEENIYGYFNVSTVEIELVGKIGDDVYHFESPSLTMDGRGFKQVWDALLSSGFYCAHNSPFDKDDCEVSFYFRNLK